MKKIILSLFLVASLFGQDELLFYCGITMVKPMHKIATIIEKKYNVKIKIIQGGSGDLYDSLKASQKGDLYLPGSDSYIKKHLKDGLLGYRKYVGYNQIALFAAPNNPKNIKSLKDLLREDLNIALGNPDTCSMGRASIKVLKRYGGEEFLENVEDNIIVYAADSRDFNEMLKAKKIDTGLNWKATAFFPENRGKMNIIEIDEKYAPKKKLVLTMLTFSKHKNIAKAFIDFASSKEGKRIMRNYGFLDE